MYRTYAQVQHYAHAKCLRGHKNGLLIPHLIQHSRPRAGPDLAPSWANADKLWAGGQLWPGSVPGVAQFIADSSYAWVSLGMPKLGQMRQARGDTVRFIADSSQAWVILSMPELSQWSPSSVPGVPQLWSSSLPGVGQLWHAGSLRTLVRPRSPLAWVSTNRPRTGCDQTWPYPACQPWPGSSQTWVWSRPTVKCLLGQLPGFHNKHEQQKASPEISNPNDISRVGINGTIPFYAQFRCSPNILPFCSVIALFGLL